MPEVMFSGPAGRLEGHYHEGNRPNAPTVLILHPHPKHGGTMNNKVTHTLYKTFSQQGFSVLRFNFRGVGRSEGVYANGEGELSDAATALDWIQSNNIHSNRFWVAGFSFGAWIALQLLMRRPEIEGFVTVSPPANLYDFSFLAPCPIKGQIIQGLEDSIVETSHVDLLVARLRTHKGMMIDYQKIPQADHFFRNHIDTLSFHVNAFLTLLQKPKKRFVA